jgi:hypothetical protein
MASSSLQPTMLQALWKIDAAGFSAAPLSVSSALDHHPMSARAGRQGCMHGTHSTRVRNSSSNRCGARASHVRIRLRPPNSVAPNNVEGVAARTAADDHVLEYFEEAARVKLLALHGRVAVGDDHCGQLPLLQERSEAGHAGLELERRGARAVEELLQRGGIGVR